MTDITGEEPFEVAVELRARAAWFELIGELDFGVVSRLTRSLEAIAGDHPEAPVVLDLRRLDFIDSAGVMALISAHSAADQRGTTLSVVRGGPGVQRTLEVAGVDQILTFVDG